MDLFKLFFSNKKGKKLRGGSNNSPNTPSEGGFMKFIKTMSWIIALLAAVVSVACLIMVIVALVKISQVDTNKNNITKNTKDITTLQVNYDKYFNKLQTNVSGQSVGPMGPQGMVGAQGPAGGLFSAFGQMVNAESQKAANVTAGTGNTAIVYMDKKSDAPNKYWYLENNGSNLMIKNKFTDYCLEADKNTGDVYSGICNKGNGKQNFVWTKDGKLNLNNTGKCVGTKSFQMKNHPNARIVDTQNQNNNNAGVVQKLALEDCQSGYYPPQAWVFN